jgi:hypothetical protein
MPEEKVGACARIRERFWKAVWEETILLSSNGACLAVGGRRKEKEKKEKEGRGF